MNIDLKKLYTKMRKLLNPEINPSEKEKKYGNCKMGT